MINNRTFKRMTINNRFIDLLNKQRIIVPLILKCPPGAWVAKLPGVILGVQDQIKDETSPKGLKITRLNKSITILIEGIVLFCMNNVM